MNILLLNTHLKYITMIAIVVQTCCTGLSAQVPELTFMPHWLPQAQFAGYYVAEAKGYYKHEGLSVRIVHPTASSTQSPTLKLATGEVDMISLFLVSALSERARGVELVNIAQVSQHSGLLFVTKKNSQINSLEQLEGKKIGIWKSGFDEIPKALINSRNIKVNWTPILSSVNMFTLGGIDAMTVMWYNEYDQIINAGYNLDELTTFFFSDYDYDIPEDGLYCLNETIQKRPVDLRKFVNASMKGWEYAREHPEEAIDIVLGVMKKAHVATNYAHQKWMLTKVLQLMETEEPQQKGVLNKALFEKAQQALLIENRIQNPVRYSDFYKPVRVQK